MEDAQALRDQSCTDCGEERSTNHFHTSCDDGSLGNGEASDIVGFVAGAPANGNDSSDDYTPIDDQDSSAGSSDLTRIGQVLQLS